MHPASDISGQKTLPGEILPTDKTMVADGWPRPQAPLPTGPFRVGRFTAVRQIGAGGMGVVYMAYDEQLDRKVAVKLLQERPGAGADPESLGHARLLREAQAMAHVSHPNVAAVYEVGTYEDQVFVAMELIEGKTLGQWLADAPRSWQEIVAVYVQAGRGLAAAHAAGLVHRDFKPENVIVGDDGRVRVLDFGLARASRDIPTAEISGTDLRLSTSLAARLTQAGSLIGTPAYMPPEQYLRAPIDARSDQFSFCVTMFEALYGARPFSGPTLFELMTAITRGKVHVPRQHRPVPGWIHEVVVRGLHVDAAQRWPDMPTLLDALGRDPARRRRRWTLRVGGVLLLGATLFAGLKARELQAQVCGGAAAQLDGVWDPARAQQVREILRASGLPYAPAAAERVAAGLAEYAEQWALARTRACEATAVRREQSQELLDRRMACLDERRAALQALVSVLVVADAAVVEKAVQAVSELPRLEPCADSAYLQARVRPPDDPAAAQRVEATRAQLSQAQALMLAGKFAGASRLVEEALAAATALGYDPLTAEVELIQGGLRNREGRYPEAEAALRRAYVAARSAGDGEVAAAAATELVGVTGNSLARFEAGALWRDVAGAEVARSGDPLAASDLARETASMAVREGDYPRAQVDYVRALTLREAVVGPGHSSLIPELNQLGAVLERQGKYAEAGEQIGRALALCEATLGAEHPLVATTADNLGSILQAEGRYEDALAQHLRGLQIREHLLGPDHLQVADSLTNLGIVAESMGRSSESEAYFRREIAIREQRLGPDNPSVALSHTNLGAILHIHGDEDGALLHLRRALEIQEKVLTPDHPETVFVLANLGLVARAQGRLGDALDDLGRALRVVEGSSGAEHVNAASIRQNLGSVLQQLGRSDEALAEFERALVIRERAVGPTHPEVATLRANIGTILALQGKIREAEPVLRRSLADLEAALGAEHPDLADPLLGLCELGLKTGETAAAVVAAERALRLRAEASPGDLALARFVLARALGASGGDRARALELAHAARQALSPASAELPAIDRWLARHRR